ncbi:hypothetical protein [Alteromonas oceanisediminis]|uniref:hypothetical protein n=1 Tax=Alteromonas oceanisediminis TaxID=2836180 RepID=UPI001BDB24E3|nr:hypothetical protein [Alteromonas oceanisediminis]MBT0586305.1 hypothetical protein [Alteromonas oceanisediminis]
MRANLSLFLTLTILTLPLSAAAHADTVSADALYTAAENEIGNDLDEAESLVVSALKQFPDEPKLHFLCGRIMGQQAQNSIFSALGYAKESLACFSQAVELEPSNVEYRIGLLRFYLGAPSIAGGDEALAWEQVAAIQQLDPIEGGKAELFYHQMGDNTDDYERTVAHLIKEYPLEAEFPFQHGLYLQSQEQYEQAHNAFLQAATLKVGSDAQLSALYQLGRTAVFSETNIAAGIHALQKYIDSVPQDSIDLPSQEWAHGRLAQLYALQGNTNLMKQHLIAAKRSDDKNLGKTLKDIE